MTNPRAFLCHLDSEWPTLGLLLSAGLWLAKSTVVVPTNEYNATVFIYLSFKGSVCLICESFTCRVLSAVGFVVVAAFYLSGRISGVAMILIYSYSSHRIVASSPFTVHSSLCGESFFPQMKRQELLKPHY